MAASVWNHSHTDGIIEPQGASEGEYDLSLAQSVGVGECEERQSFQIDLDDGEIG
jgi:hypothetical protein